MGHCPACEYDLSGLGQSGTAKCPECGREVMLPGVEWGEACLPKSERRAQSAFIVTPLIIAVSWLGVGFLPGLAIGWVWGAGAVLVLSMGSHPRRHRALLAIDAVLGGFVWMCVGSVLSVFVVALLTVARSLVLSLLS